MDNEGRLRGGGLSYSLCRNMYVDRCEGGLREGLKYLEMITAICRKMNLFVCIIVLIFKLLVNSIFAEHNSRVEIK